MEQLRIDSEALSRALPYLGVTLERWQAGVRDVLALVHADAFYDPIRCGPVLMNSSVYVDRAWSGPIRDAFEQLRDRACKNRDVAKRSTPLADLAGMQQALEDYCGRGPVQ